MVVRASSPPIKFYTLTIITMGKRNEIKKWDEFWRLTLTWNDKYERRGKRNNRVRFVECMCSCWNTIRTRLSGLMSWNTKSCWCLQKEHAWAAASINSKTHWESKTVFYRIRKSMNSRCNNPHTKSYKIYWERWIKCKRNTFESFKNDMYKDYIKHLAKYWRRNTTIDRINSNWDYCKENCRRSTQKEQQNNRRDNVIIEYKWEKYTLQQLSDKTWIKPRTITNRLHKWRDINKVISEPIHKNSLNS